MIITKPLLATALEDPSTLVYPVGVCEKIDGIRALRGDDQMLSRTFKPIRNKFIQDTLQGIVLPGMDGELLSGDKFQDCTSAIMSADGEPDFVYNIFDWVMDSLELRYSERMYALRRWFTTLSPEQKKYIKIVDYTLVNNVNELLAKEAEYLAAGHEGLMVRKLDGRYKCGRSSLKEGILLKFKRFVDAEAEVIGVEERMHNDNVAEKDNFGRTKRSQDQDGMTPAGDLGALVVRDILTEVEFCIGSGFDAATRIQLWKEKGSLPGKIVKYRYFPTGVKDKPRFPTFLGFRDEEDM